ncbi:hypothetical protein DITRI_Ditri12bG0010100 [Diplodiscus trichospermus]
MFRENKIVLPKAVSSIRAALSEFFHLKQTKKPPNLATREKAHIEDSWKAPQPRWVKVNCDGSFKPSLGKASLRVVLRNHHGSLIDGHSAVIQTNCALVAEARAVHEGIALAIRNNCQSVGV